MTAQLRPSPLGPAGSFSTSATSLVTALSLTNRRGTLVFVSITAGSSNGTRARIVVDGVVIHHGGPSFTGASGPGRGWLGFTDNTATDRWGSSFDEALRIDFTNSVLIQVCDIHGGSVQIGWYVEVEPV